MIVYGSKISYFTGKLEAYLRFKGFEYEHQPTMLHADRLRVAAGTVQMPIVEFPDGRFASDSTPIIAYLEAKRPEPSVYPADPALRFVALFIEDYADEWLWRPAMHYRWSYAHDREFASSFLADEQMPDAPVPREARRELIQQRQRGGFVTGDGVTDATWDHVEAGYHAVLEHVGRIVGDRPFLLGEMPTIADFGLMGPMLRHFSQDPTPARIMREDHADVFAWVMRVWAATPRNTTERLIEKIDDDLHPLLREAVETHLAQQRQNAEAFASGADRYAQTIQGCRYEDLPVSRYRVWCLEQLRGEFAALDDDARSRVRAALGDADASLLWQDDPIATSEYDPDGRVPFNKAINVYGDGL